MSNPIFITGTTFTNVSGEVTYGYRMYDNETQCYDNTFETLITDDFELLAEVVSTGGNEARSMLDWVRENKHGLYINDTWYEWKQIKKII